MKKLTAVLLAIMVTISACASPSGNSGDVNSGSAGSEANGSRTASEGATREAGAAEFQLEIDEGFVSAEESGEAEAAAQTEETSEEAAAQAEETSELYEEEEALSNLVILEEGEENYRSAADRKNTKATDVMHSEAQKPQRMSLRKKTILSWSILWAPIWRADMARRPTISRRCGRRVWTMRRTIFWCIQAAASAG